ncbi:MAG: HEAT repeat domain-containing protein [Elusimicrobia bacterium]|nr:HEAT repeat domain-containing protein [Elusimicrobiota bacterium]
MRRSGGAAAACLLFLAVPGQARPSVGKLMDLLAAASPERKPEVLHALGRTRKKKAVEPLLKMLDFQGQDARMTAAVVEALGEIGDDRALASLKTGWEQLRQKGESETKSAVVRAAIVDALGKLQDPGTADIPRAAIKDADPKVREAAVRALGRRREASDVELLIEAARSGAETAKTAIEWLSEFGGPKAGDALKSAFETSTDPAVKAAAAYGLAKSGDAAALEAIRAAMTAGSADDSLRAAAYLARLGRTEGLEFLSKILADPKSPRRAAAAEALGSSQNVRGVDSLMDAMSDPEPEVRGAAAAGLGRLGGERAWYVLRKHRSDADAGVRDSVRIALTDLGDYAE